MTSGLTGGLVAGSSVMSSLPSDPAPESVADDARAMLRLAHGEIDALGELYDRYQAAIRRFAIRMSGSADDAEDVVHATFLAALKSASSFDPARSCRTWLLGIAANLIQRERSKGARWKRLLAAFRPAEAPPPADPERALATRERVGRLERALLDLPEPKRLVVIMAELEGMSGEAIAEALGIPVGTVWTRLHHARRELAQTLDREEST
jgi:RNA polymerase sigma-70 factor (ECF subfamily)